MVSFQVHQGLRKKDSLFQTSSTCLSLSWLIEGRLEQLGAQPTSTGAGNNACDWIGDLRTRCCAVVNPIPPTAQQEGELLVGTETKGSRLQP